MMLQLAAPAFERRAAIKRCIETFMSAESTANTRLSNKARRKFDSACGHADEPCLTDTARWALYVHQCSQVRLIRSFCWQHTQPAPSGHQLQHMCEQWYAGHRAGASYEHLFDEQVKAEYNTTITVHQEHVLCMINTFCPAA